MAPSEELQSLLAGLLDGPPDCGPPNVARSERLCALLRDHPELQEQYLDHARIHALLLWRKGGIVPAPQAEPIPAQPTQPAWGTKKPSKAATERRKSRGVRWALAFSFLIATTALGVVLGVVLVRPSEPEAGPEVVAQLVGWNLEISQAPSHHERKEIYDSRQPGMHDLLNGPRLSPEDRALAETLVQTSVWLTSNNDPVAEAERFGDIADVLLVRLDSATDAKDVRRATKFADAYRQLRDVGVAGNLERAFAIKGAPDVARKRKLERLLAGDNNRAKKLEELLERNPDASWKAIQRALKGHHRRLPPGTKSSP